MNTLMRYIFQEDIVKKYVNEFNSYMIDVFYGDNILIGSEIEDEYKNIPPEGE